MKRLLILILVAIFIPCLNVSAQTLTAEQRQVANAKLMPYLFSTLVDVQSRGDIAHSIPPMY